MATPFQIDPKLLDILRCPVAVHYKDHGDDPGKLELVRGYWLVSADSGYKYPIIDGIPKMLIEEGARWKDVPVEDLPVPPPNEPVYTAAEDALTPEAQQIVGGLDARSKEARTEAVKMLDEAAQSIRREAQPTPQDAKTRAEEIAIGLEQAARYVERGSLPTPAPAGAKSAPVRLLALIFGVGLVVGMLMRGGKR